MSKTSVVSRAMPIGTPVLKSEACLSFFTILSARPIHGVAEIALTCAQGEVYDKVIKVVCEQSQVDFEEGGVDESTLKLLKSVCGCGVFIQSLHRSLSHPHYCCQSDCIA